jgi:hypothetical protein
MMERDYTEADLLTAGLILKGETGKIHDRFRNRLMFPIQDSKGRFIGFGARALDDSMPKYLNSPQTAGFDKSSTLYAISMPERPTSEDMVSCGGLCRRNYGAPVWIHQRGGGYGYGHHGQAP